MVSSSGNKLRIVTLIFNADEHLKWKSHVYYLIQKSLSASYMPSIVLGVGVTVKECIYNVLEKIKMSFYNFHIVYL